MISARAFSIILPLALLAACGRTAPTNTANSTPSNVIVSTSGGQRVTINSPDGLQLVGTLLEADKPNSPALLLLHQWQSDRHSFDDFARRMHDDGFSVLSIDGRGFGESTKKTDGSTVVAERTDDAVKVMLSDVRAAIDFLSKQKNVNPDRIGIVGASYGSSLAIIYAGDDPKVAAVALLSPGLNYFGNMQTEPAVQKYGDRPLFMAAAEDDPDSNSAAAQLNLDAPEPHRAVLVSVSKGGHGTALLKVDEVRRPLESFLIERLGLEGNK